MANLILWVINTYSLSTYCLSNNSYAFSSEKLLLDRPTITLMNIFLNSRHWTTFYSNDVVRRYSVLITLGSLRFKEEVS